MYCSRCGAPAEEGASFCIRCGAPVTAARPAAYPPPAPPAKPSGIVGFWRYVGLIALFAMPVIGLIACIVFACNVQENANITNFARAFLAVKLVLLVVVMMMYVVLFVLFDFLDNGDTLIPFDRWFDDEWDSGDDFWQIDGGQRVRVPCVGIPG